MLVDVPDCSCHSVSVAISDDRRAALGGLVEQRRLERRLTKDAAAEQAGMSPVTWSRVEDGKTVRALTYVGVEQVLGWKVGSSFQFLIHERAPVEVPPAAISELEQRVRPDEVEEILALIERSTVLARRAKDHLRNQIRLLAELPPDGPESPPVHRGDIGHSDEIGQRSEGTA